MIRLPERDELRTLVRTQLSTRALFPATGISSIHRGTGRPCRVCDHPIDSPTLAREVEGSGVVVVAHPACYAIWREESAALRQPSPRRWGSMGLPRAW